MEEFSNVFTGPATASEDQEIPVHAPNPALSDAEREVYEALDCYPTHIDALAAKTGTPAGRLAGILLNLELKSMVLHSPGNMFSLKSKE
jgi:DNA processing protein